MIIKIIGCYDCGKNENVGQTGRFLRILKITKTGNLAQREPKLFILYESYRKTLQYRSVNK